MRWRGGRLIDLGLLELSLRQGIWVCRFGMRLVLC